MRSPAHAYGDAVAILARGMVLQSASVEGIRCQFKTVYDVVMAPVAVTQLDFCAFIDEPDIERTPAACRHHVRHPADDCCGRSTRSWPSKLPPRLRLFINGEPSLRAALLDTLLLRTCGVFARADAKGAWSPLASSPLSLADWRKTMR